MMAENGGWNSMKKKCLLGILPALLVLSSCQAAPRANVLKEETFIEDTLAHDEIFGNQSFGRKITPYKLGDDPVEHPDNDPAIGVQTKIEGEYISFRFVAAVEFTNENIGPTNAVWKRTVSKPDGQVHMDTDTIECATAYTKLGTDGDAYTIEEFNAAQEPDTSYTHFVVYTLRGIKLANYSDYYISAYLTLSGEGGVNKTTKAIVTTVDTSIYQAAYAPTEGHYYLEGTINGTPNRVPASRVRNGSNKAEFEYVDFVAGDVFTINEFYDTKLYIHGSSECLFYEGSTKINSCFEDDETSAHRIRVKTSMDGSYGLYLNNVENKLYTEDGAPYNVLGDCYIKGTMNGWVEDPDYRMMHKRGNIAVFERIAFAAGDEFKVYGNGGNWYGWRDALSGNFENSGGNIKCINAGDYTVYLNESQEVWVEPAPALVP